VPKYCNWQLFSYAPLREAIRTFPAQIGVASDLKDAESYAASLTQIMFLLLFWSG